MDNVNYQNRIKEIDEKLMYYKILDLIIFLLFTIFVANNFKILSIIALSIFAILLNFVIVNTNEKEKIRRDYLNHIKNLETIFYTINKVSKNKNKKQYNNHNNKNTYIERKVSQNNIDKFYEDFRILGFEGKKPNFEEFKKQYHVKMQKYHPDKAEGDAEKALLLNESYKKIKKEYYKK